MTTILDKLSPIAKAVVAAVVAAIVPLLIIGFTQGFDWKAIAAAAGTAFLTTVSVYLVPNTKPAPAPKVKAVKAQAAKP